MYYFLPQGGGPVVSSAPGRNNNNILCRNSRASLVHVYELYGVVHRCPRFLAVFPSSGFDTGYEAGIIAIESGPQWVRAVSRGGIGGGHAPPGGVLPVASFRKRMYTSIWQRNPALPQPNSRSVLGGDRPVSGAFACLKARHPGQCIPGP